MTMDYENILYEKRDGIAFITVNRPKVLNALNRKTVEELGASLFGLACATEDMREGTKAFLEKRQARFKGK